MPASCSPRTYAVPIVPTTYGSSRDALVDATPARVADDIEHRRESLVDAELRASSRR